MAGLAKRQPCTHCPWRVGVDAWAIGRDHSPEVPPLHHREMLEIAHKQRMGMGATIMACHLTHRGEECIHPHDRACVGYEKGECAMRTFCQWARERIEEQS